MGFFHKKDGFKLSDRQLRWAGKAAKACMLWCASGVVFYGVLTAAGLVALGLHAAGVAIPHFLGVSSTIFGAAMGFKSVVLQRVFSALHASCGKALVARGVTAVAGASAIKNITAAPSVVPPQDPEQARALAKFAAGELAKAFNSNVPVILTPVRDKNGTRFETLLRSEPCLIHGKKPRR
jgi:hypothetical protein